MPLESILDNFDHLVISITSFHNLNTEEEWFESFILGVFPIVGPLTFFSIHHLCFIFIEMGLITPSSYHLFLPLPSPCFNIKLAAAVDVSAKLIGFLPSFLSCLQVRAATRPSNQSHTHYYVMLFAHSTTARTPRNRGYFILLFCDFLLRNLTRDL